MSAPNKRYDPVEVSSLSEDEVQRAVDDALAAVQAATTLDGLRAARVEHAGDRGACSRPWTRTKISASRGPRPTN